MTQQGIHRRCNQSCATTSSFQSNLIQARCSQATLAFRNSHKPHWHADHQAWRFCPGIELIQKLLQSRRSAANQHQRQGLTRNLRGLDQLRPSANHRRRRTGGSWRRLSRSPIEQATHLIPRGTSRHRPHRRCRHRCVREDQSSRLESLKSGNTGTGAELQQGRQRGIPTAVHQPFENVS